MRRDRPLLVVAGLLRDEAGRVLLARRPPGKARAGLWEFPGGKVRPGESPEEALRRELREELALEVQVLAEVGRLRYDYPEISIELVLYEARPLGTPRALENQELGWFPPEKISGLPLCPADRRLWEAVLSVISHP